MKYCIGCVHLYFEPKVMGYGSTMTGSWTREEAALSCSRGHWREHLQDGPLPIDLERAMETAETCADFSERIIEGPA
jgi:hypothetical protein